MDATPTPTAALLFISHAAMDKEIAHHLKEEIQRAYPLVDVFVSSDPEDLPVGDPWVEKILAALDRAKLVGTWHGTRSGQEMGLVRSRSGLGQKKKDNYMLLRENPQECPTAPIQPAHGAKYR
jgi:hypothetical protein